MEKRWDSKFQNFSGIGKYKRNFDSLCESGGNFILGACYRLIRKGEIDADANFSL